ncbi:hypothetical protein SETIT_7G083900v2 [Setaria italica]|uniref:RING-type domain-containing protein n=1 Tax=Setaria italica TaxID=4555 RepID=K3Y8N9_SETIT|nr:probable BOI-related E3 ubiquitin-protein ligase 2 [Setaria italica]RCV33444.1 hypothetical protein SETIT_7G083900v2 [Setaria italica]
MAVQARHLSHAFPPYLHSFRAMDDVGVVPGTAFFDEYGLSAPAPGLGGTPVLGDFPRSELTCNYGFEPRKRPRVTAEAAGSLEDRSVVLPPAVAQELVAAVPVGNGQRRAAGSGTASTSGRLANGAAVSQPQGLLSRLCYHQDAEIDALLTLESERMRAVLEAARRRHARALLAAVDRAASGRLRAAEAELERALRHNAELEEKARQMGAECQAWMDVAQSHEAVAAGLRATLDQLLQSPRAAAGAIGAAREGDAEDAQSCCFEAPAAGAGAASRTAASSSCRACGGGDACVLLLPCRHLCLCLSCEAAVDACPICAAAKNASLHVLLS